MQKHQLIRRRLGSRCCAVWGSVGAILHSRVRIRPKALWPKFLTTITIKTHLSQWLYWLDPGRCYFTFKTIVISGRKCLFLLFNPQYLITVVVRKEKTGVWLSELQWWPESRKGLGDIPILLPPFFWATFLSNLLCMNAAQKLCQILLSVISSKVPACKPQSRASVSEHRNNREQQDPSRDEVTGSPVWPVHPVCEIGLGLCRGPHGGALGWLQMESPVPWHPSACLHMDGFWLPSMSVFPCSHLYRI